MVQTTPIEFRYISGALSSISRVPTAALGIVANYDTTFCCRPVYHDDETWSEFSDLDSVNIKCLQNELAESGYQWTTKFLA